jgi:hypothetical protein
MLPIAQRSEGPLAVPGSLIERSRIGVAHTCFNTTRLVQVETLVRTRESVHPKHRVKPIE